MEIERDVSLWDAMQIRYQMGRWKSAIETCGSAVDRVFLGEAAFATRTASVGIGTSCPTSNDVAVKEALATG